MKTFLIALVALVVIGGGYYWYTGMGIVEMEETNTASAGKLDINAVCEGALAYMTFENGDAAATFVADCKEGKHPEVIERYKAEMNLGDGAAI